MATQRTVTEADAARAVDLPVGSTLDIVLREQPAGGYRWEIEGTPPAQLRLEGPEARYATGTVGGASQLTWRVTSVAAGACEVRFRLWRPWEGERSVVKRLRFPLSIVP